MKILLFITGCLLILAIVSACCKHLAVDPVTIPEKGILIDVRSVEEFNSSHLPGSFNIPHTEIGVRINEIASDKSTPLYLYCRSGRRVGFAMEDLKKAGYTDLHNLGGMDEAAKKLKLVPVKP